MADEKQPVAGNPWEPLLLLMGVIVGLTALMYVRGGLTGFDAKSLFVPSPIEQQQGSPTGTNDATAQQPTGTPTNTNP